MISTISAHAKGGKIPGLQILKWEAILGEWSVTIKIKGLTFAGVGATRDQAMAEALDASGYSDLQPYSDTPAPVVRAGGGGGGNWGGKKKAPELDLAAKADEWAVNKFFGRGRRDFGWDRSALADLVSEAMGVSYAKDIEYSLTNQQLVDITLKLENGQKATAPIRPATFNETKVLRDLADQAGLDAKKLNEWLAQGGLNIKTIQVKELNVCIEKMRAIAAEKQRRKAAQQETTQEAA
jgi:hypothetical protein